MAEEYIIWWKYASWKQSWYILKVFVKYFIGSKSNTLCENWFYHIALFNEMLQFNVGYDEKKLKMI